MPPLDNHADGRALPGVRFRIEALDSLAVLAGVGAAVVVHTHAEPHVHIDLWTDKLKTININIISGYDSTYTWKDYIHICFDSCLHTRSDMN